MLQRVSKQTKRNFTTSPFSGPLSNEYDGFIDIGASYWDFDNAVFERAKDESCASVLNNCDIELMTDSYRKTVQRLVQTLEEQELGPTQLFKHIDRIGKLRQQLNSDMDRRRSLNNQAAKVLVIRSSLSSITVQTHQEEFLRSYGTDFSQGLKDLIKAQKVMYFGEAHCRKDEAIRRIALIGWAANTEELLMLIGQLVHIFRLAKQWLISKDLLGQEEPYDITVPNFGESEQLRFFLQRIDSDAQQLNIFRITATEGLSKGKTFSSVVESIQKDVLTHVPSLNNAPHQKQSKAFHAGSQSGVNEIVDKNGRQGGQILRDKNDLQQVAFQAGQVYALNKRVRSFNEDRKPIACRHWDGQDCNYETVTSQKCNFSDSHATGVSSYAGPYIPKVKTPGVEDFELWWNSKAREESSSK
jgi:hypothetical protein